MQRWSREERGLFIVLKCDTGLPFAKLVSGGELDFADDFVSERCDRLPPGAKGGSVPPCDDLLVESPDLT